VFSFSVFHFLVIGSVRLIKMTRVSFRAHVKIASHIVSSGGPDSQATCSGTKLAIPIRNESVLIQLAQCRFSRLAISNAKILIYFSNKIHESKILSNNTRKLVRFEITKMLIAV